MFAIKFINQSVGYVIGGSEISKTTDGGNSWVSKYDANGTQLNDITTFEENTAWVVGSDIIVKTNNSGEKWSRQPFSPYHYLFNVNCSDSLTCFAIGGEGALYKTIDGGGITSVDESISKLETFQLYQNYPNPFNPKTIISYSLSNQSKVRLTVYNLLGQKISLLVNTLQNRGTYEIEFNGANLPSGTYFYKLEVNNQIFIKKLLLLK